MDLFIYRDKDRGFRKERKNLPIWWQLPHPSRSSFPFGPKPYRRLLPFSLPINNGWRLAGPSRKEGQSVSVSK